MFFALKTSVNKTAHCTVDDPNLFLAMGMNDIISFRHEEDPTTVKPKPKQWRSQGVGRRRLGLRPKPRWGSTPDPVQEGVWRPEPLAGSGAPRT